MREKKQAKHARTRERERQGGHATHVSRVSNARIFCSQICLSPKLETVSTLVQLLNYNQHKIRCISLTHDTLILLLNTF